MVEATLHNAGEVVNGDYKLAEQLGKGAMGEVFVATDIARANREIAIKYLKWQPGKSQALDQFKSEFAMLTHLSHPHIAKVYDFEQDIATGQFFFTSELVKGVDFLNAVQDQPINFIEELFVQALRALEYIHSNGIFHFDIKSANLLVTTPPLLKLIDFGLSAIRFQGKLVGTPSYMAPEMVRRENPDGRADLYSLGVLVYSALTGRNPFRAADFNISMQNQLNILPPPPSSANSEVPKYMDTVIMRLMEKRPEDRYQTAAQAIRDLSFRSPKKYEVETDETRDSYIPWESKFVGREKEVSVVKKFLENKKSSVIIVRGANGAGKSRFLTEVKYLAQINEWTTSILTDPAQIGEWQQELGYTEDGPSFGSAEFAMQQPLLVAVDDYHNVIKELWGAHISETCSVLAKRISVMKEGAGQPIILIITCEGDSPPSEWGLSPCKEINLSNFTDDELKEYLAALIGSTNPPDELVEQIFNYTGGNPFIVTEVAKALVTGGALVDSQGRWKETTFEDIKINLDHVQMPASVEERMLADYIALPDDAKSITSLIAVLGRGATANEIVQISGQAASRGVLASLSRRGVIKFNAADGSYCFSRPLAAKAIYNQLPEKDRAHWHDKIAEELVDITPEHLYHIARGSDAAASKDALTKLIAIQTNEQHNHDAIGNILYYLAKWDEPEMCLNLARLYNRIGKYEFATKTAEAIISNEHQVAALETIGISYLRQMKFEDARKNFLAAMRAATALPLWQRLKIENYLAEVSYFEGDVDKALEVYKRTTAEASKLPREEQLLILNNNLGQTHFQKGDYKKAIEQLEKDLALYHDIEDRRFTAKMRYALAESYRFEKMYGEAANNFNALVDYARETGDLEHLFRGYNGMGNIFNDQEKWQEAAAYYKRAVDVSLRLGMEEHAVTCIANLGVIIANAGDLKEAIEHFTSALAYVEGGRAKSGLMQQLHCRIHLELGEAYRQNRQFKEAGEQLLEAEHLAESTLTREFLFWIKLVQLKLASDMGDKNLQKLAKKAKSLADTPDKLAKLKETVVIP